MIVYALQQIIMIKDEMPAEMFREMMEQLKRIEKQLFSSRIPSNQYLTISERSKSNMDLKINIANSQISRLKISVNEEPSLQEEKFYPEKQKSDQCAKPQKDKNSRVQRNQQKFQPISRVLNTMQIESNSPIQQEESNRSSLKGRFDSESKTSKNQEQSSLPLAASYFKLSQSKLDSQLISIGQRNDQEVGIIGNDFPPSSFVEKERVTFPLCLQTPIKAVTEGVQMTSQSKKNIEELQTIANRNKLLLATKSQKMNQRRQEKNQKWAIESTSKVLKQQKISKPQKGYSNIFLQKNRLKQTTFKGKPYQRYNTTVHQGEGRLNYHSKKIVSKEKLHSQFSNLFSQTKNTFILPQKQTHQSFQQQKKQLLLKLRKRNNLQNSLRKSSKQASVPYIQIKTTQKKGKNHERVPKRQKSSSSIEQITQRLHSGSRKDPCLRFRDRSNSLLKEEFNKLVKRSSLAKRNIDRQDRDALYQQLRQSKESQSLWPSIITARALEKAKSRRQENA